MNAMRSTRARVSADLANEVDSYFFVGLGGDVSRGGVFIATWREIPIGERVAIEVTLDDGPLRIEGTVRWTRAPSAHAWPGLGVAFDDLSREDRERVEAFCDAHAPVFFELDDAAND